jgi:hypothetical protein
VPYRRTIDRSIENNNMPRYLLLHFTYYFTVFNYVLFTAGLRVHGFQQQQHQRIIFHTTTTRTMTRDSLISNRNHNHNNDNYNNAYHRCLLFSSFINDGNYNDEEFIIAATQKLTWEINEKTNQKPLLDLSLRDTSPEEYDSSDELLTTEATSDWDQGQQWKITLQILSELIDSVDENDITPPPSIIQESKILGNCPQLFRLEPIIIEETAQCIIDEFGIQYLQSSVLNDNPIILSYKADDVVYGLQFMTTMMMTDSKPACAASSSLLLLAINGGIQERAVSTALGAAADATSKANKSIASDTMQSLRQIRTTNRNKK